MAHSAQHGHVLTMLGASVHLGGIQCKGIAQPVWGANATRLLTREEGLNGKPESFGTITWGPVPTLN